ncbi:MAG: 6-phosphogluconolactonase [Promethearchaeota archaeon]
MRTNNRSIEVRTLLKLTPEEAIEKAGNHLIVCEDLEELHEHFAEEIAKEIESHSVQKKATKLILPVGPTGQYPILARIINEKRLSLKNCWFFFMDEYCSEDGRALPDTHPLSFKRIVKEMFFDYLHADIEIDEEKIIFPNEKNIKKVAKQIASLGGIDTCHGGIGIHGHVAFNEPQKGVEKSGPRKVALNAYTITINAIRANVGGNIENFPKFAFTLGMREILNSKRIRLYCRNGTPYDWANTILRIALFGAPGPDYPVTFIRNHPDYIIITDKDTLQCPKYII